MTTPFSIRSPDPTSEREMNHPCVFLMMTLWESRPKMRVAPASIPDFSLESHRQLY